MMQTYEIFPPNVLAQSRVVKCKLQNTIKLKNSVGLVLSGVVSENLAVLGYESSITIRLAGVDDLLNIESIFNSETPYHEFICESATAEIAVVDAEYFRKGISSPSTHQDIQLAMAKEVMRRLHLHQTEVADTFIHFSHGKIEDRVLWALKRLQRVSGLQTLDIRQRRIAAHIGVAKETVSRAIGELEHSGKLKKTGYTQLQLCEEL